MSHIKSSYNLEKKWFTYHTFSCFNSHIYIQSFQPVKQKSWRLKNKFSNFEYLFTSEQAQSCSEGAPLWSRIKSSQSSQRPPNQSRKKKKKSSRQKNVDEISSTGFWPWSLTSKKDTKKKRWINLNIQLCTKPYFTTVTFLDFILQSKVTKCSLY